MDCNEQHITIRSQLSSLEDVVIAVDDNDNDCNNFSNYKLPNSSLDESVMPCLQAQIKSVGSLPLPLREKLALLAKLKAAVSLVKVGQDQQQKEEERRRKEEEEEKKRLKRKFRVAKVFKRRTAFRNLLAGARQWAVPWKSTVKRIECK